MSLLTRLISPSEGEVKIPVHQFMSALAEYKRPGSGLTRAHIVAGFNLSTQEETQLDTFLSNLDTDAIDRTLIHDVLMLGETGHYDLDRVKTRLGIT